MNQIITDPSPIPSDGRASWVDHYLPASSGALDVDQRDEHALLDIAAIRGFLWRQRLTLIGVIVAALMIGFIATMLISPTYSATATMRIDPTRTTIIEGQDLSNQVGAKPSDYMATLVAVIKSRTIALKVAEQLKLGENYAFIGLKDDTELRNNTGIAQKRRKNMAAAILQSRIDAQSAAGNVLEISYTAGDPVIAAMVANGYAVALLENDVQVSLQKNAYALDYLIKKIDEVRRELSVSERASIAYARGARIVSPSLLSGTSEPRSGSDATPQTVVAANLASVNSTYTEARAKRIAAEQRWNAIKPLPTATLPEVQANSAVQELIGERSKKLANLAQLKLRYGDAYPQVRELSREVVALTTQINNLSADLKDSIRQNYIVSLDQERALAGELDTVSTATLNEQDRRVQFNQLDRKAKSLATQLDNLMERYNQIASAANIQPGTISRVDPAIAAGKPTSPNLAKNLTLALVLGLALAVAFALAVDILDDRLRSVDEVQRKLGIKSLGTTPKVSDLELNSSSISLREAHSSIRVMMDFSLPKSKHNIIMFTSSMPAEGKTTTAVGISRQYARLGRRVLLIDGDLRKPTVPQHFEVGRAKVGIVEVLLRQVPLEQALLDNNEDNLDVLPVGLIPANPVDIISSQRLVEFLEEVRTAYDIIIIDCAPVMGLADSVLLAGLTDGVVFMIGSEKAHFGSTKAAIRRLRHANANILGAVLTKYNSRTSGEDYYYSNYYSYGQKDETA